MKPFKASRKVIVPWRRGSGISRIKNLPWSYLADIPKEGSANLAKEGIQKLDHHSKLGGVYENSFAATRQIAQTRQHYSAIHGWHL
jgi:hypothetical protein